MAWLSPLVYFTLKLDKKTRTSLHPRPKETGFYGQRDKNVGCQVTFSFDKKACQHENFKLISLDK